MTFNLDHGMETPSQSRRKAKEDAEHAALNALLEQGKFPNSKTTQSTMS